MSNDNKTLADVQPGGRVRLGDGPLQKAYDDLRFYVDASQLELEERGISREDALDIARESEAALSAQPSPGGQGGALPPLPPKDVVDTHLPTGVRIYGYTAEQMQGYARAALAARQPVGEPVALVVPGAPTRCRHCESTDLEWFAHVRAVNDVPHGRLTTHDVGCVFVLGCNECSETLHTVKADSIAALLAAPPAQAVDLAPRPMATAPHDGTMVRLLVQFKENATEDTSEPTWTIGACNDDNVGEDERIGWQFAGWCWTHDHFTEGKGTPVGWLPMIDSAQAVDLGQFRDLVTTLVDRCGDDLSADQFVLAGRLLNLIDSQAVGNG